MKIVSDILKRNGYSMTRPRQVVFKLLEDQEPQSMHELCIRTKGDIDRASLYRIIRIFEQVGIVQRVYIGWKYKLELTDIFIHHHHHISCVGCHKLIALNEDTEIENLIQLLAKNHHVRATSHQLEIQGYCQDCQRLIKTEQK